MSNNMNLTMEDELLIRQRVERWSELVSDLGITPD